MSWTSEAADFVRSSRRFEPLNIREARNGGGVFATEYTEGHKGRKGRVGNSRIFGFFVLFAAKNKVQTAAL